jgi:hypothetical protein
MFNQGTPALSMTFHVLITTRLDGEKDSIYADWKLTAWTEFREN